MGRGGRGRRIQRGRRRGGYRGRSASRRLSGVIRHRVLGTVNRPTSVELRRRAGRITTDGSSTSFEAYRSLTRWVSHHGDVGATGGRPVYNLHRNVLDDRFFDAMFRNCGGGPFGG